VTAMPAIDPVDELAKKPYLTRTEAAALARISTWTLDGFAREPDFPMLRLGARIRVIPTEAFLAWLKTYSERLANPLAPRPEPPAPRSMGRRR